MQGHLMANGCRKSIRSFWDWRLLELRGLNDCLIDRHGSSCVAWDDACTSCVAWDWLELPGLGRLLLELRASAAWPGMTLARAAWPGTGSKCVRAQPLGLARAARPQGLATLQSVALELAPWNLFVHLALA